MGDDLAACGSYPHLVSLILPARLQHEQRSAAKPIERTLARSSAKVARQHFISKTAQIERLMRRFGEAAWGPKFGLVNFSTTLEVQVEEPAQCDLYPLERCDEVGLMSGSSV